MQQLNFRESTGQLWLGSHHIWGEWGRTMPEFFKLGPKICRVRAKFGRHRAVIGSSWPHRSSEIGPTSVKLGQKRASSGRIRCEFGSIGPNLGAGRLRPGIGQAWLGFGHLGPTSAGVGPKLATLRLKLAGGCMKIQLLHDLPWARALATSFAPSRLAPGIPTGGEGIQRGFRGGLRGQGCASRTLSAVRSDAGTN